MEFALSNDGLPRSIKGLMLRIWPELSAQIKIGAPAP